MRLRAEVVQEQEGEKTFEQLCRVSSSKRTYVRSCSDRETGEGVDPHLKVPITIPENPIELKSYDNRLADIIADSEKSGWALDVIDDCLFLAAYRKDALSWGPSAFRHGWFYPSGGERGFRLLIFLPAWSHPSRYPCSAETYQPSSSSICYSADAVSSWEYTSMSLPNALEHKVYAGLEHEEGGSSPDQSGVSTVHSGP